MARTLEQIVTEQLGAHAFKIAMLLAEHEKLRDEIARLTALLAAQDA